jgi:hypothetical protein
VRIEDDRLESEGDYDADDNDEDEDETDDDVDLDVDDEDDDEEEEEENQVVPWSSTSPPPSPSSSSTRDYQTSDDLCSKRMPDNFPDLSSDEDFECKSSEAADDDDDEASPTNTCVNGSTEADVDLSSIRPLKVRKMEAELLFNVGQRSAALVESLKRLHQEDINPGSARMCRSRF